MPEFNAAQKEAIYSENKSILASAGAGAGKTSVMSERVIEQILNHGKTVDQMLVVTFTNEAAYSMKDKIRKRLNEIVEAPSSVVSEEQRKAAASALLQIHSASISTIHSFCMNVLRNGYMLVNIDPSFGIVEDVIRKQYFRKAVRQAIDNIAGKNFPAADKRLFGYFKRSVSASKIEDICMELHNTLMGVPEPYEHMHKMISDITLPVEQNPWAAYLCEYNNLRVQTVLAYLPELEDIVKSFDCPEQVVPFVKKDITILKELQKKLAVPLDIKQLLAAICNARDASLDTATLRIRNATEPQRGVYERYKEIHTEIKHAKGLLGKVIEDLEKVGSPKCVQDNVHIQQQLFGLEVLMREVGKCFTEIKNDNTVLDFSDLEQFAYQVLTDNNHPEVRDAIRERYTDVFVDECQDVSGIQYAIINALKSENTHTFFVGDLKQSIYRFRHADPLLFLGLRDRFQEDKEAEERLIYFQHNYRSSASIIDCVNSVFSSCMDRNMTEIDYEPGDHLIVGRPDIPSSLTDVILIDNNTKNLQADETKDKFEAQSVEAAKMIQQYLDDGYSYKDIVILMRSTKSKAPQVRDWLTKLHVPVYYQGKYSFYKVPEIALFVDLLRCIDNGHQDIPLLSTLKNPPFNLTDNELAEISKYSQNKREAFYLAFDRCAEKNTTLLEKKCFNVRSVMNEWRVKTQFMTASEIIWMLLKDYGIYSYQSALPGGEMRQKNLSMLHQKAVMFEKNDKLRLSDFLNYIVSATKVKSGGGDAPVPMGENDDFVRIMTIHASKGLEFPVVIIMDANRPIHSTPQQQSIVRANIETNEDRTALGLYMPYSYKQGTIMRNTYGVAAFIAMDYMNELAEETRMLYVAMTRAQERLLIIGNANDSDDNRWNARDKASRIFTSKSMLDMLMPSVLGGDHIPTIGSQRCNSLWRVSFTRPLAADVSIQSAASVAPAGLYTDEDYEKTWEKTAFTTLPAKTAVTSVIHGHYNELAEGDTAASTDESAYNSMASFELPDEVTRPRFLEPMEEERSSASIGTIIHRFMRLLNLSKFNGLKVNKEYRAVLEEELDYMLRQDAFSADEAKTIQERLYGISKFLMSDLGKVLTSGTVPVMREKAFTIRIHVEKDVLLVQGVIDVLYRQENGNWVIIDYKTDYDTSEAAIKEKHTEQLNCYRMSIERTTGIRVDHMWVAALRDGSCHEIAREDKPLFRR